MSEFDFGVVPARGQDLRHEFRWTNRSERPIRVVGSKVNVPCCSRLGELPTSVPAGGSAVVPAFLKVGRVAGQKRVTFDVETDAPSRPVETFTLLARFVPEWEIQEITGPATPLLIGQASSRTYRLIARRKAGEGRPAPSEVIASEPLRIESLAPAGEVEGSDGVIESTRQISIALPPRGKLGPNQGAITLRWPDGQAEEHAIAWTVEPRIRLSPAAVVLKPSDGTTTVAVEVRSVDRPFAVTRVAGPLLVGDGPPVPQPSTSHKLRLALDPARLAPGVKPEVEFATDDPDQPLLKLGVLVMPREEAKP